MWRRLAERQRQTATNNEDIKAKNPQNRGFFVGEKIILQGV